MAPSLYLDSIIVHAGWKKLGNDEARMCVSVYV